MTIRRILAPLAPLALPAQEPARITTGVKDAVVKGVLDALDRGYVFPGRAAEVRKSVTSKYASGAYANIEKGGEFAIALTRDLQEITRDKHLRVRCAAQGGPVHLNSLYFRPADRTDHFYTQRTVRGPRFGADKPVYVLRSQRTFSAAEEFTYNLQSLKRATIVGETTGGGAHPGGAFSW